MNRFDNSNSPDNFQPMLKESIDRFLCDYRNGVTDFSNFTLIFCRLLQNLPDPSLEYVWFYSALNFHSTKFTALSSSEKVLVVKELFQLLVSCSSSCSVSKKVAVLCPVLYELYHLAMDKKVLKREVESLLEVIVSYISICCGTEPDHEDRTGITLNSCFSDVVRVWVVDEVEQNCEFKDDLRHFLPIVNDKDRDGVGAGCRVGHLAEIVICEAFFWRLFLKFGCGILRADLENELRDCAVQMMNGFRSYNFIEILLRMLLQPVLPVTSFLDMEDIVLVQQVLYDAVVTSEHLFLCPQREFQLPCRSIKNIAVAWLLVVETAIRFARKKGDQARVISYINSFSKSCLISELIKWVTNLIGKERIGTPNVSAPVTLLKWLLIVEDQGVRVFDCDNLRTSARSATCESSIEFKLPSIVSNGKLVKDDVFAYDENEGRGQDKVDSDLEMADYVEAGLTKAPGSLRSMLKDNTKKRKEGRDIEGEAPCKFAKFPCKFAKFYLYEKLLHFGNDDGLSSGSEVDNPISDEDMEDMNR